ncbi:hypothetical protein [Embleya scabrispora]|nr:hypothetical protein [Embleya scabrispora]
MHTHLGDSAGPVIISGGSPLTSWIFGVIVVVLFVAFAVVWRIRNKR